MSDKSTNDAHAAALALPGAKPTQSVAESKKPYTLDAVNQAREYFNNFQMILGGDRSAYYTQHLSEYLVHAVAMPDGPVRDLPREINPDIANLTFLAGDRKQSLLLGEYINNGEHRVQGALIVKNGKVVYENFFGLVPYHAHILASVTKTLNGLMCAVAEADGKIDMSKPPSAYVGALKGTEWDNVPLIDVVNMRCGLDISETQAANDDPKSMFNRMMAADCGSKNSEGVVENSVNVLKEAKVLPSEKPGEYARYSSVAAKVICMTVEAATNQPLTQYIEERMWTKIGARGPMLCGLSPQGGALVYGYISMALEDLARYAMIYTPNWRSDDGTQIVSPKMLDRIRYSGDKLAYEKGDFMGHSWVTDSFTNTGLPMYNSWNWDAIWEDGAMFKHGNMYQGIYVHPEEDYVGVYFSTSPTYLWADRMPGYIRAVSQQLAG